MSIVFLVVRNYAGLLGSADIELVVKDVDGGIPREQRRDLALVAARAIFIDLRYNYTATVGKQVFIIHSYSEPARSYVARASALDIQTKCSLSGSDSMSLTSF